MGSDAGSGAFRGKRRREEPHQFLSSAGQGTTSKRRKPDSSGDDGSMESKYGAAASRMMANMGFKPGTGLGKDGQGIVAPLEGVSRPAHAGLGSVDEHRPFFHGKENLPPPPPALAEEESEPPRWSRKAAAARKSPAPVLVLPKSALLTTRAEQVQPMVVDRVIDMLTDLAGLNDEQDMEVDEGLPMAELQH
jgi:hypothetical protein